MTLLPFPLLWALASPASAALTLVQELDEFDAGPTPLVVSSGSQQQNFQASPGNIPGDWRSLNVSINANPFFQDATVGTSTATEQFFAELGPGVTANLTLTYDANQVGLGGFDLEAGGATSLGLLVADSDANLDILITLIDTSDEVATLQVQQTAALTSDTLIDFPFASFTNAGATDFSQIDSIQFDFDNGVAGDFTFKVLGTYSNVPEPSTSLLALSAGVIFLRRNRRP